MATAAKKRRIAKETALRKMAAAGQDDLKTATFEVLIGTGPHSLMTYYQTKVDELHEMMKEVQDADSGDRIQQELKDYRCEMTTLALAWSPAARAQAVRRNDDGWGGGGGPAP